MSQESSSQRHSDPIITNDQIRERAYDIWERHHRPDGFEVEFWLLAKQELIAEWKSNVRQETQSE